MEMRSASAIVVVGAISPAAKSATARSAVYAVFALTSLATLPVSVVRPRINTGCRVRTSDGIRIKAEIALTSMAEAIRIASQAWI